MATIYCPECRGGHSAENVSQEIVCKSCGNIIEYEDFTCNAIVEEDDHGAVISNLNFLDTFQDIRSLNGYKVGLVGIDGETNSYASRRHFYEGRLKVTGADESEVVWDDCRVRAFCIDRRNIYYVTKDGIFQSKLDLDSHGQKDDFILCNRNFHIYLMISYKKYFVFLSNEGNFTSKLMIMPKDGKWLRELCDTHIMNIYGNWVYFQTKNEGKSMHFVFRKSLDGKEEILMTSNIAIMSNLNVNRYGVFFTTTDNLGIIHRIGLHSKALFQDRPDFNRNDLETRMQLDDFNYDLCRGYFSGPLLLEGEYMNCEDIVKISVFGGEWHSIEKNQ
jgi:hypothetical protein